VRKVDPQKHDERRREILDAAGRCFARDGFRGASISEICKEADISPGQLYHYFENKEAIVRAMTEVAVAEADMQLEILSPAADPITTLVSRVESARAKLPDQQDPASHSPLL
jgi:AcrR family transcriptional regulator